MAAANNNASRTAGKSEPIPAVFTSPDETDTIPVEVYAGDEVVVVDLDEFGQLELNPDAAVDLAHRVLSRTVHLRQALTA